ncbi:MAG: hypothetical protein HOV81_21805 [Kofleriaceae bacterium]|nr:hypothetical protein [Kofleriaceae bacterium]
MGAKSLTIKVSLTNEGEDVETPWAQDLGPVAGRKGARKVRLVNVPFLHAKPTWGDVIIVEHVDDDCLLTWDRGGLPWSKIGTRIHEDGGRWAMIVDYEPHPGDDTGATAFRALSKACTELEIICEGCIGPRNGKPGRAYLAVPRELTDPQVMTKLRGKSLPCELIQIHPAPPKRKPMRRAKTKRAETRTAAKKLSKPRRRGA